MHNHTAQNEQAVTLVLPLSQINLVLEALAEMPLKRSRGAFNNIESQATADLKRQQTFLSEPATDKPNTDANLASQESQGS